MTIKGWIKETKFYDKNLYVLDDGMDDDYCNRLACLLERFEGKPVRCRYMTRKEKFTDIDTEICNQLFGEYNVSSIDYGISECTTDYYDNMRIGGHDLYNELESQAGRYLILEIEEVKCDWE